MSGQDDMSGLPPDYEPPSYTTCDGVSERCPVEMTVYGDYFTKGACIFFVAAYGVLLLAQSWLAWKSRAWSFATYLAIGSVFELMGYAARIALSDDPWIYDAFVIQLLMLILGPTLVAASISVTFKHLVLYYGRQWSFLAPRWYPWVFVGTDFFSIVIQAAGGGVSAVATDGEDNNEDLLDVGSGLLVAGVVFQLVNMVFCGGLMLLYIWRRNKAIKNGATSVPGTSGSDAADSSDVSALPTGAKNGTRTQGQKVKIFIWAISAAYICIIIRCIYRIPEMQLGWGSTLMQNETTFLILDGAMILLSAGILTTFHPAFYFPYLGKKKNADGSVTGGVTGPSTAEEGQEMTTPAQK